MKNATKKQPTDATQERIARLRMDEALERIAREFLDLETLETRKSDSLDFSQQAVWTLRNALEEAYKAGQADAAGASRERRAQESGREPWSIR